MTNWEKYGYPYKSPHWKKAMGKIFNQLNEVANDPVRLPGNAPMYKKAETRNTPQFEQVSKEILDKLDKFSKLDNYKALKVIEDVLPLRYIFVLPKRHAIVAYSAYANLLSKNKGKLATYSEVQDYLGIPMSKKKYYGASPESYYVYYLISSFRLHRLAHPFRGLLGLKSKMGWRNVKFKNVKALLKTIEPMKEWETLKTPTNILKNVYKILKEHGFDVALQYVRYIFRGSWKMRRVLNDKAFKKTGAVKLGALTERYLTTKAAKKRVKG